MSLLYAFLAYASIAMFAAMPDAAVALFHTHALAARMFVNVFDAVSYAFAALLYTDTTVNTSTEMHAAADEFNIVFPYRLPYGNTVSNSSVAVWISVNLFAAVSYAFAKFSYAHTLAACTKFDKVLPY